MPLYLISILTVLLLKHNPNPSTHYNTLTRQKVHVRIEYTMPKSTLWAYGSFAVAVTLRHAFCPMHVYNNYNYIHVHCLCVVIEYCTYDNLVCGTGLQLLQYRFSLGSQAFPLLSATQYEKEKREKGEGRPGR